MNKFRMHISVLSLMAMLLSCSCGFFSPQKYVCNIDEVETIEIVKLGEFVEAKNDYEYTVISTISDKEKFVERLNNIKHSVNWGDPGVMKKGYIVIKICYKNGDSDLIYRNAQSFVRSDKWQTGFFFFDIDQFNALISDYTTK